MGGGTTCLPWVIVNEKLLCLGIILIILGSKVKLDRWGENSVNVWLDSSAILINNVISVEEGNENKIGTTTGAPLVETEIEGTVIVG